MLASWRHLYDVLGLELDLPRWLRTVGGDVEDRYAALAERAGPAHDRDAAHDLRRAHELSLVGDLPLRDGWYAVLDHAHETGLALAVVSSSPLQWVAGHLERLGVRHRFAHVVTREDAARVKPHPDLYLVALQRLAVPAAGVLAVEDSLNGVAAAHAAGLRAVAVPNPVTQAQAHVVPVLHPAQVLDHL